jgi:hypothetical protein
MRYIPQTPQEVESFAARATEMTAAATPQAPVVPIPEQPDIYKCLGAANDQSMLDKMCAQLTAPGAEELTKEEEREIERDQHWDEFSKVKDGRIDRALARSEALFGEAMALTDELQASGTPIPDCSDLIPSNAENPGMVGAVSEIIAKGRESVKDMIDNVANK